MSLRLKQKLKHFLFSAVPGLKGKYRYFNADVYFDPESTLFRTLCLAGVYEADVLNLITRNLNGSGVFVDVGANIGLMAIPVLNQKSSTEVWSFEPSPETFGFLAKTCNGSDWTSRWQIFDCALGRATGTVEFHVNSAADSAFDGIKNNLRDERVAKEVSTTEVSIRKLDDIWIERGKPAVSVIKIDVEGTEADVILGARHCIAANKPIMIAEWSRQNCGADRQSVFAHAEVLLSTAREVGYSVFAIPNLQKIENGADYFVLPIRNDNFLLVPNEVSTSSQ